MNCNLNTLKSHMWACGSGEANVWTQKQLASVSHCILCLQSSDMYWFMIYVSPWNKPLNLFYNNKRPGKRVIWNRKSIYVRALSRTHKPKINKDYFGVKCIMLMNQHSIRDNWCQYPDLSMGKGDIIINQGTGTQKNNQSLPYGSIVVTADSQDPWISV